MIVAYMGGVPLEEIAPSVAGAGSLPARAWLLYLRRRREPGR